MSKKVAKTALVSSKAPNPTTYSNSRSKYYLSNQDELVPPSAPISTKFFINLQDLVCVEEILETLVSHVTEGQLGYEDCERWWMITDENSILRIDQLFKREEVKNSLKQAVILESVGVTLAQFLDHSALTDKRTREALKSLLVLVHQNFLVLIDIALHRLPSSQSTNSWAVNLQSTTTKKRLNKCHKSENFDILKNKNIDIKLKLQEIAREHTNPGAVLSKTVQELLFGILQIIKDINEYEVIHARNILRHLVREEAEPHILNTTESMEFEPELPLVQAPYISSIPLQKNYTLVLDLDETLVHYLEDGSNSKFLVRPGCYEFLQEVSHYYEIVIFTAALQDYADWVLNQIDKNGFITARLYRQHAIPAGNFYIKDLSRIGRDLAKTIIVDNMSENFQMQPDNGILIRTWFDDAHDNALLDLLPLLIEIACKQVKDVRRALRSFRDQMMQQIAMGVSNPHLNLQLEEEL